MNTPKLNILVAYPYFDKKVLTVLKAFERENPGIIRLMIDSGAFTAYTTGKVIPLEEYLSFIDSVKESGIPIYKYYMLDVIGDPEATMENYKEMLKRGYDPMPVITFNETPESINEYYKTTDYISLGGLQFKSFKEQVRLIANFTKVIKDRKYHILGLTGGRIVKTFRPYSCDSSSFSMAARYGNLSFYKGMGKFETFNRTDFVNKPPQYLARAIANAGFKASDLAREKNWRGANSISRKLSARWALDYSIDCEKNISTKIFLATGGSEIGHICNAYRKKIHGKDEILY